MQSTGILAGSDVEYYEQDPQYAKAGFIWLPYRNCVKPI